MMSSTGCQDDIMRRSIVALDMPLSSKMTEYDREMGPDSYFSDKLHRGTEDLEEDDVFLPLSLSFLCFPESQITHFNCT